ncbi:ATP-binding protein [Paraburkholderia sp. CNPSo 3076]|uniref:ATP-binding protein n=1 Tax=Paraburkholderia sp. CNPSo 3076 TaxID=2940936 RepID=UPI0022502900|nr:ATP-binding protein [Paraburkholderia sp. CNPSo 3076]MCX5544695.1 ATP-binding protein [Paraburkholderia sp. CNPSo 3076]
MNVFVAGIHAVGKSYLCEQAASAGGWQHSSASALIKQERGVANWSAEKRVDDPDSNQRALVSAVNRINGEGTRLLLDGHFVLRGKDGSFIELPADVFEALNLSSVVLIEAPVATIAERLRTRDDVAVDEKDIEAFLTLERKQAESVCTSLGLPLTILCSPDTAAFANVLSTPA